MVRPPSSPARGFTLVELTVVVALIAIATTLGIRILSAQLEASAVNSTRTKMNSIREALINYYVRNLRLPCPDSQAGAAITSVTDAYGNSAGSVVPPDGIENVIGTPQACAAYAGGPTGAPASLAAIGLLPYAELGLARDTATDAWGNMFTYLVTNGPAGSEWTQTRSASDRSIGSIAISNRDAAGNPQPLATAVVTIVSHGPNGFGAITSQGSRQAAPLGANVDEAKNVTPNTNAPIMVWSRQATDATGATGGTFDDIVSYLTATELIEPLIRVGAAQSSEATARQLVSQARNALIANMSNFLLKGPAAPYQCQIPGVGALGIGNDPWGQPLNIIAVTVPPTAPAIINKTLTAGTITIYSYGRNLLNDSGLVDDIAVTVPVTELQGILAQVSPTGYNGCGP